MANNATIPDKLCPDDIRTARSNSIVELVSRDVKLRKEGHEYVGLCPFHEERTPSFSVNERKGLYQCFGCGAAGDIIDFARHVYRLTFPEAVRMITGDERLKPLNVPTPAQPENDGGKTASALKIWQHPYIVAVKDSIAQAYLRSRAIEIDPPPSLRFHPYLLHKPTGLYLPALVGAVTVSPSRQVIAIHRTFLKRDGSAKIPHSRPRAMLGPCKGGAVRLAAWTGGTLAIAEGIETGLSILQMTGLATWAALSDGGIANLVLPKDAKDILICADHDDNGVGQTAARRAAEKWDAEGRNVKVALPIERGTDFNDMLKAGKSFAP